MLIDAGMNIAQDRVINIIAQETDSLKYAIPTHFHEDHIGGMDEVINRFDVENVIVNDLDYASQIHDTECFNELKKSIENKKDKESVLFRTGC